jgi:hypothetical protein
MNTVTATVDEISIARVGHRALSHGGGGGCDDLRSCDWHRRLAAGRGAMRR